MNQIHDKRRINFTIVENELIDDKGLDVYTKMTYIVLCRFAKESQCFPSYQTIADKVGCSKRKIIDTTKILIDRGLIEKEIRKNDYEENTSNLYTIVGFSDIGERDAQGSECDAPPLVNVMHHPSECDAPKQDIINNTNIDKTKTTTGADTKENIVVVKSHLEKVFDKQIAKTLSNKTAQELLQNYQLIQILSAIEYAKKKNISDNVVGYIIATLKNSEGNLETTKNKGTNYNTVPQLHNFEQRKYEDEDFDIFYKNV